MVQGLVYLDSLLMDVVILVLGRYDAAEEKKVPTTKKPKSKIPKSAREGGLQESG